MKKILKNKKAILLMVSAAIIVMIAIIYISTHHYSTAATYFTFDESTGRTIVVGPDADKWIPIEEYNDNSWWVDFDNPIYNNGAVMYRGYDRGWEQIATKEYWNAIALLHQPETFFGYVYIGD